MGERADRDEEELQEILEKNPRSETGSEDIENPTKCIFCDNWAYMYVEAEDVGLEVPQDVDGPVPVCEECYPYDDECIECLVGNYCPEHMTKEEYLLRQLVRDLFDYDDYDDDDE